MTMAGDPKNESQRLAELYGGMTEGELKKLASDAGSLTDTAVNALKAELSNRGSKFSLEYPEASADNVPHPKLVTLRQFRDLPAALLAKSVLDSAGIECFLADENTIRMDWLLSNVLGGIKLWVTEENAAIASELLGQESAEGIEAEDGKESEQPRCPQCGSANVLFEELSKHAAYATVLLGVPIPLKRLGWKCHSCGYHWEESGDAPQQDS
jgi:rubredoxin